MSHNKKSGIINYMKKENFPAKGARLDPSGQGPASGWSVTSLVNNDGCFDLQFRKDTRRERTNSPTYYRWKAQFVITAQKENIKLLEKVKKEIGCGEITISKDQARLSVQKIDDISEIVAPYFRKNSLAEKKKKDFELWAKGVEIIKKNKGKPISNWKKNELCSLIEIHKSSAKYKSRPRAAKWIDMAKTISRQSKFVAQ
ncbi:MAG: hypothetical protein A2416_03770 [Candidatus Staskawiczbacteria bacterium RIFOXYC1_FULL_37_52]|nr:MAG: hypothetical protein A2416_03770 [Candidatus Staskawiczbacteria bacterium RIFOXYC1_FULL_37_52]